MTYHTILRNSTEFTEALRQARILGQSINDKINNWPHQNMSDIYHWNNVTHTDPYREVFPYR